QRALGASEDRGASFQRLADSVARLWPHEWIGLLSWDEDGLGGSVEHERGADGPAPGALTGWLVREAESGLDAFVAPGAELGREGVVVAFPLRRDNSALVGFLIVAADKLAPRHVELALLESLQEIGVAFVDRSRLPRGAGRREESQEDRRCPRERGSVRAPDPTAASHRLRRTEGAQECRRQGEAEAE